MRQKLHGKQQPLVKHKRLILKYPFVAQLRNSMRYLITHEPDCRCPPALAVPTHMATPEDVTVYCWGIHMTRHTIYDGECPYFFFIGHLGAIAATLRLYAAPLVRHCLPLLISVAALGTYGIHIRGRPQDDPVCQIGDDACRYEALGISHSY
jgi:hypothetical protein